MSRDFWNGETKGVRLVEFIFLAEIGSLKKRKIFRLSPLSI
ncbi:hypothetical protein NBRC111893_1009 [Lentilactobacillus kosonis]|uniref:Uncharacterized protein n=1 Tax=Lentilactobacillus kosonis TaxID=2810561 RepID=A0A401FKI4_9LACO|nr:hypothetical protein NBRC111893_1009 [Lentilactobacillus kosonis]